METIKRCVWCVKKHRMDEQGNAIPGPAEDKDYAFFSDGVCKIAEEKLNKELDNDMGRNSGEHQDGHTDK
jgi:hypothetical protein